MRISFMMGLQATGVDIGTHSTVSVISIEPSSEIKLDEKGKSRRQAFHSE